jgi:hypothetical protein
MAEFDQYCNLPSDSPWVETPPGTTQNDLPIVGNIVSNPISIPPNSVEVPLGFDPEDPDLCIIFNDLLVGTSGPIYPLQINTSMPLYGYTETITINCLIRLRSNVQFLNYNLTAIDRPLFPRVRIEFMKEQDV